MSKSELVYNSLLCECELAIDNFLTSDFSLYKKLIDTKLPKMYANKIADYYLRLQEELRELVEDKTPDLVEAYGDLKIPQRKKFLAFVTSIVDDAMSYAASKKKVRVKRKISSAKIVSKLKYKQADADFKLNSIDPVVIPQSEILFVFNTKYRDLFIYRAKEGEMLSVKGTTIQNFDEKLSGKKKVRKPEDTLNNLQQTTRLRAIKAFDEIKTKSGTATGRINSECILLRAL